MKTKYLIGVVLSFVVGLSAYGIAEDMGGGKTSTKNALPKKAGDAYLFWINNIQMPMNSHGVMAAVNVSGVGSGQIDGKTFLFSGGFVMSGLGADSLGHPWADNQKRLWANADASASRVEDYLPGRVRSAPDDDAQIYVIDALDTPFGSAWQQWSDAVKLGADFYDGDGDGVYNPIDKNGNGKWDPDEDRPDLLADQTAWMVYNDGKESADRTWKEGIKQGIDIQQSTFGFRSAGLLGNIIFLRYRLINRGLKSNVMDSVYFAVWADPDLGDPYSDMVGCDTLRSGGYTYNSGPDAIFGPNPPCYFVDFFQGPIAYVPGKSFVDANANGLFDAGETTLDTAISVLGPIKGIQRFPGASNLKLSSFVNYVQSDPNRGDPARVSEARGYTQGRLKNGTLLDPCTDTYGKVFGLPCTSVNPTYWYSGDINNGASGYGWIFTTPGDQRQMQNVGPFQLEKDKPVDIVVAMIVGRGASAKGSVAEAQHISDFAQFIYDRNFSTAPPPPSVAPIIRTTDNTINLAWETQPQVKYRAKTVAYDVQFEGYQVWMYRSNSTAATESGLENAKMIAKYDMANNYDDILNENGATGERTKVYEKGTQLDSVLYGSSRGRISLTIDTDPFTNGPLIKGKPYYFAITSYALNHDALVPVDTTKTVGNYMISKTAFIGSTATVPIIFSDNTTSLAGIHPGSDFNDPFQINTNAQAGSNLGDGNIVFDEVYKAQLTGNDYKVSFFKDAANAKYSLYWKLTNTTTNSVLLDSQRVQTVAADGVTPIVTNSDTLKTTEGFTTKLVGALDPTLKAIRYSRTAWYKAIVAGATGAFYPGSDLPTVATPGAITSNTSKLIKAENLRQVQLRFGPTQKAYRFVKKLGFGARYYYAGGFPSATDSTGTNFRRGFVDVPFQAWIKDDRYGESRQLAVAFCENGSLRTNNGIWNPGSDVAASFEYIVIFNRTYSTDSLALYAGVKNPAGVDTVWGNITGWNAPAGALSTADSTIAANPYFDALCIIGLERKVNTDVNPPDTAFYAAGDTLTVPIAYTLRTTDNFTFTTGKKGAATQTQKAAMFSKATVYPNPLFAYNSQGSYVGRASDDAFVTFANLPPAVTIKIYSISGSLLRVLDRKASDAYSASPSMIWDLLNQDGLRVASGMYVAVVSSPGLGEKILKFAIIMPQKQIQRF